MTLGTTLSDTIKEELAFSKLAAQRYAQHSKGDEGMAEVAAFEGEIKVLKDELTKLIVMQVPSAHVRVDLKGPAFKVFGALSLGTLKPYDTNTRGEPLDVLSRSPMYAFGARSLREWARQEGLDLTWKARNDDMQSWWSVQASPMAVRAR